MGNFIEKQVSKTKKKEGFNKILNLKFQVNEDGSVVFEDGILYESHEVDSMRRIKELSQSEASYEKWIKTMHIMKKSSLDLEIGIVVKYPRKCL